MNHVRPFWAACLTAALLWVGPTARAEVRLPKIFGSHMVLQQEQQAVVWGWADAGEEVTVSISKHSAKTKADKDGKWQVKLDVPKAGGPYELSVEGTNKITLDDVLVGEVWICSGQSNMEWPVQRANDSEKEIAAADYPQIRLFKVGRHIAKEPQDDCQGTWDVCSPKTVPTFTAVGYFFGRDLHKELEVPVGLVETAWGGTIADTWTSHSTLTTDEDFKPILDRAAKFNPKTPNQASALFNGMLHPLIPLSIRGAIWYQGESNVSRAAQYKKLFPAMITDWRKHWDQGDFPFLFVQLAPYRYGRNDPRMCAELWEAQRLTLSLPNTGMAVTTDIGNTKNIHPTNKQEVGRRLALWALAKTYDRDLVYSGPLYKSMKIEGNKIRLTFDHVDGGLLAEGGKPLTHFTIAGEDRKFVPAEAEIDGETVVVQSSKVAKPVAVRFAWQDDAEPNFFNQAGLPASPFRTDDFPLVTAGRN